MRHTVPGDPLQGDVPAVRVHTGLYRHMKLFNGNLRGNRKFTIAVAALLISAVGLFVGRLTGAEWVTVSSLIVGLFSGANAAIHMAGGNDGPNQDS